MPEIEFRSYSLYLFDLDDTLTRSISGEKFPKTVGDRVFIDGRWEHLLNLYAQGNKTAICTNQGGAAWGLLAPQTMNAFLASLCESAEINRYFACYHDTSEKARNSDRTIKALTEPDIYKEWDRRKPGPGMLIEAMDFFEIGPEKTLYVGDREEDRLAAEAASVDFAFAWDYFKEGPIIV
jgi:D-glycero-D-manno-heptose 1,7-bisphosphate phosphatase